MAHGMEIPERASGHKAARIRKALSHASAISPNSNATRQRLEPYLPPNATVTVILPPCTDQLPARQSEIAALRQRLGENKLRVITLARLEPRKGIDALIRAVALLQGEFPSLQLAVAGSGEDRARLESIARKSGVDERVIFLGRISEAEKSALFALGDVFAMPSYRVGESIEGFGRVYVEAALMGLPSIAGRDGGAADAVLDGKTGLLCDGTSVQSVAEALGRMLRDPRMRKGLAEAAEKRAKDELSWRAGAKRYLALAGLE